MKSSKNTQQEQRTLQRIARYLMLHSSHTTNTGLLNGKTGITLFFYHYARYTNNKIYEKFAGELLDEIYREIHDHYSADFKNGLCGIGWGMEYLIQGNFVEADADEVLEELDRQIIERDVRRIHDASMETGLQGIASYMISRLVKGGISSKKYIKADYIKDLIYALETNGNNNFTDNQLMITQLKNILTQKVSLEFPNTLSNIINKIHYNQKTLFTTIKPLGIANNGYAGIGLKLMGE